MRKRSIFFTYLIGICTLFGFALAACGNEGIGSQGSSLPTETQEANAGNTPTITETGSIEHSDTAEAEVTSSAPDHRLIERARKFVESFPAGGFEMWQVLDIADDIPPGENPKHQPDEFCDLIHSPRAAVDGEVTNIVLFAWTSEFGTLVKWDMTVDQNTVLFARAEVVETLVGELSDVPTEGSFLPTAGKVMLEEALNLPLPR